MVISRVVICKRLYQPLSFSSFEPFSLPQTYRRVIPTHWMLLKKCVYIRIQLFWFHAEHHNWIDSLNLPVCEVKKHLSKFILRFRSITIIMWKILNTCFMLEVISITLPHFFTTFDFRQSFVIMWLFNTHAHKMTLSNGTLSAKYIWNSQSPYGL